MTCFHPGHKNCNQSLSNSVSGGQDQTVQMLKTWVHWGHQAKNKEEHKSVWSRVLAAKKKGQLPTLQELEAGQAGSTGPGSALLAPADRIEAVPKCGSRGSGSSVSASRKPTSNTATVAAVPGTPPVVAARMQALVDSGAIGQTTPAQRRRNPRTQKHGLWCAAIPKPGASVGVRSVQSFLCDGRSRFR